MLTTSEVTRDSCQSTLASHTGDSLSRLQAGARDARDSGHQKMQVLLETLIQLEERSIKDREALQQMAQFVHQWVRYFIIIFEKLYMYIYFFRKIHRNVNYFCYKIILVCVLMGISPLQKDAFVAKLVNLRHVQGEWWSQTTTHLQSVERQYRQQQETVISERRRAVLTRRAQAEVSHQL